MIIRRLILRQCGKFVKAAADFRLDTPTALSLYSAEDPQKTAIFQKSGYFLRMPETTGAGGKESSLGRVKEGEGMSGGMHRGPRIDATIVGLVFLGTFFLVAGCATAPSQRFDPGIQGPQMIVQPESVSLGVAAMSGASIVFKGNGFQPKDSVFIQLLGVRKGDKLTQIPVADAEIDEKGAFQAQVATLVRVAEFLNAAISSNEKMENIIVVSQPPIPPGTYTARAVSMESDKTAECKVTFTEPSAMDGFKDWLGGVMGKIVRKK